MSNSINDSLQKAKDTINHVISNYLRFMGMIGITIVTSNEDVEINKRKLLETKKEFYNFLDKHKNVFEFRGLIFKTENKEWPQTVAVESFEDFIKIDEFMKYISEATEIKQTYPNANFEIYVYISVDDEELENIIKSILGLRRCRKLRSEDIRKFYDNNFLVDKEVLKTKCSNYEELQAYIEKRLNDYKQSKVSAERINEFSFNFHYPIPGFEDEKSCVVCLEDYKEGQEICRLPCNHFCCRVCTEEMFQKNELFQCPICRGDCT